MELKTIPRLPMPGFETKPFNPKLAQCRPHVLNLIKEHYDENPAEFLDETQRLKKLRKRAAQLHKNADGLAVLKRYFCQLYFLRKKFPSLEDATVPAKSDGSWKESLSSTSAEKTYFRTEFTTSIYNIAALHTQLGAECDRTVDEGLNTACNHFQRAAWAFEYLCDIASINAGPDFSRGYFEFVISTCLAQAQECIAEKTIAESCEPDITAKIVAQVGEYYQAAKDGLIRHLQEDTIFANSGIKRAQVNLAYAEFKLCYYRSIKNFFLGLVAEKKQKFNERVAYFKLSVEEFGKARLQSSETTDYPFNKISGSDLKVIQNIIEKQYQSAVDENENIYLEEIPSEDKLEQVEGIPLVKCISFDPTDPKISGPDFFSRLTLNKVFLKTMSEEERLLECMSVLVQEEEVIEEVEGVYEVEYSSSFGDDSADPLSSNVQEQYNFDVPEQQVVTVQNSSNATYIICQSGHRHNVSEQKNFTIAENCFNQGMI